MQTRVRILLTVTVIALLAGGVGTARAGTVATIAGRKAGPIGLQHGSVRVGGETVAWAEVMLVVNDPPPAAAAAPHALRMKNGEVWVGQITRLNRTTVTLASMVAGERQVDMNQVAAIDFVSGQGAIDAEKSGTLYRDKGKPVAGKILWLRGDKLAIDTPIGAVELKAAGLRRYVFYSGPLTTTPAGDEVRLADGSILRGAVEPGQDVLQLDHSTLGKHRFSAPQWTTVRRYSGPAIYLSDLPPLVVETFPLIRRPADKPRIEFSPGGAAGPVSRIVVAPKSRLTYKIPGQAGEQCLLTAEVRLADGSRGTAHLEIRDGQKLLLQQVLVPGGDKPLTVSLTVPSDSRLEIQVDFGDRVRFPCHVALDNALLVRKK